jgi:hypothetical protein
VSIEVVVGGGRSMAGDGAAKRQRRRLGRGRWAGPELWSYPGETGRKKEVARWEAGGGGKPVARKITGKKKATVTHFP